MGTAPTIFFLEAHPVFVGDTAGPVTAHRDVAAVAPLSYSHEAIVWPLHRHQTVLACFQDAPGARVHTSLHKEAKPVLQPQVPRLGVLGCRAALCLHVVFEIVQCAYLANVFVEEED